MTTSSTRRSTEQIRTTQNLETNLRRQLAARRVYKTGKRIHFYGASFAILLALLSPVVLLYQPTAGPMLGAVAGVWIFLSRLVFEPWRQRLQLQGATAQELFDCNVLGLDWNESLARRMSEEEVRRRSGSLKGVAGIKDWYPGQSSSPWPASVLICQRANAVWARRQHRVFGWVLVCAAVAWATVGGVVSVLHGASLSEYLVTIALPSLPALLDAAEMSRAHLQAADARQLLEDTIDARLRGNDASETDLREIQDQLFGLRRQAPLVPEWFYKIVRTRYEQDMQYAAEQVAAECGDDIGPTNQPRGPE